MSECEIMQPGNRVDNIKYLDSHLNFISHINNLCGKVSCRSKLLWRIRGFIDFDLAKMLYVSLTHPDLLYCNFVIDGATTTEKKKLQTQQNAALCAVCNVDYSYPTAKLFSDIGVDTVQTCMMKTTCKLVYKGMYNMGPNVLNEMFVLHEPIRELRSSHTMSCEVARCHTQFGMKNVAVRGARYWNMLPYDIKSSNMPDMFKERVKKYTGFD